MDTVLGLLAIALWIFVVVGLAAAVTYVVVKVSPAEKPAKDDAAAEA